MKTVLKLLKNELNQWETQVESEKEYWKGYEDEPIPKKFFKAAEKNISELKKAIEILSKQ